MRWKRKMGAYRLQRGYRQARVRKINVEARIKRLKKVQGRNFVELPWMEHKLSWEMRIRRENGHWSEPKMFATRESAKSTAELKL